MKTDVISVSSSGARMAEALQQIEKAAAYKGLTGKNALHLRLMTEEMMGLMRSITGETEGEFWMEDSKGIYELHLRVENTMGAYQRQQLINASSSGKNEAPRGLMGRIRAFFEPSDDASFAGLILPGSSPQAYSSFTWTMEDYRDQLRERGKNDTGLQDAWDEMEKSVIAHVADNVKVSIHGDSAELILIKCMA